MPRLHVNVDHVATLRQARRESFPDPVAWALAAEDAGAHGITCHLRKDRRHMQDGDVARLREGVRTVLNLETSLDPEMLELALKSGADCFCLVPENRQEVTTEGGLDVRSERGRVIEAVQALTAAGGLVSLFVDPDRAQIEAAREVDAALVELHTGRYATPDPERRAAELERLRECALFARELGLRVNAGHGLDYANVTPAAALPHVEELNIGFAIVARALDVGVSAAVSGMLELIEAGARDS